MTSKREEIEARLRDAVREGGGWPNDAALERYIARAVDETIAALAVFEQAHTPTDDERELLAEADALVASWDLKGSWTSESPVGLVTPLVVRAACICTPAIAGISDGPNVDCPEHGEHRPVQGEPTEDEWRAGEQSVSDAMHYVANPEPQGEPSTWSVERAAVALYRLDHPAYLLHTFEAVPLLDTVLAYRKRAWAALRAAAVVTEQGGENR